MANPEENNALFENLMARRTVVLEGEINSKSISQVAQRMFALQARSGDLINLLIDSGGGSIRSALQLCDAMEHILTAPVRGIAFGACHSAATFVMLHCSERVCTPYSKFVIHSGTMSKISLPMNETTEKNLEHLLAESKSTTEMVVRLYMSRLNKSREQVEALIGRGDQNFNGAMTAQEAVEIGLVEKIIEGKLDIFPSAES